MLLEAQNLKVHYGKAEALKSVSVRIDKGEVIALIGANGAGKSTALRTISGLKIPTSGNIWFQGKMISGMRPHEIVRLGISHVPEGRRVLAPLTVLENLEMGAYVQKNRSEIARSLNNIYEHFTILKERQDQIAGSLSGGEQQMLAVARALMSGPKLLLMDEPSLGLSPMLVEEVSNIIQEINRRGVSIILVEQNAQMALNLANRAYVLELGRIALEGDSKELVDNEDIKKLYLGDWS